MKKKKVEGGMMEEAIEKASQLIGLLQRQNKDIKRKAELLEKECESLKRQNYQIQRQNDLLGKKCEKYQNTIDGLTKELESGRQAFQSVEQSLKKRVNANKQLHEKISNLTARLKEKTKECSEQKTKLLSLQNQNKYLIKKLEETEQKQNDIKQIVNINCNDREYQLKQAIRLKQAFSRRCQELKADNQVLLKTAADYKQRALNKVAAEMRAIPKQIIIEQPLKLNQSLLSKLITQKLGIQAEPTAEKQYQQLSSFIQYRLAHLEKLWQDILSRLEKKQWGNIFNLKDLHSASQRIYVYLNELLGKAN